MHEAPPVLSALDLIGVENELILIELDQPSDIKHLFHEDIDVVFFGVHIEDMQCIVYPVVMGWHMASISTIVRCIKQILRDRPPSEIKINFLIHRIDLMDLEFNKKERGSRIKGYLSMLGKKTLQGSNVIITSCKFEPMLRDLCDRKFLIQTKPNV